MSLFRTFYLVLLVSSLGYSVSIDLITTTSNINADLVLRLTCGPDPIDTNCNNVQFTHNNSLIDISNTKYTFVQTDTAVVYLTVNNVVPTDAGDYVCRLTCSGVNYSSEVLTLTFVPPVIFLVPDSTIYDRYVGSNVTFLCVALHYSQLQWQDENGQVIRDSERVHIQGTNLTLTNIGVNDEATYVCAANNPVTFRDTVSAILRVYMKPTVTAIGNTTVVVSEGNSTSFTCTATGIPRPSIVWANDNNLNIGGRIQSTNELNGQYGIHSTLTISHIQNGDSGVYKCNGVTLNGTSTETFTLQVYDPPTPFLSLYNNSFNATNINLSWIISGVPEESQITITWRLANASNVTLGERTVMQGGPSLLVSSLWPDTSYVFTAYVLDLTYTFVIKTSPLEPSFTSAFFDSFTTSSLSTMTDVSSYMLMTSVVDHSSSMIYSSVSSQSMFTPLPTVEARNSRTLVSVSVIVGVLLFVAVIMLIIVIAGVCLIKNGRGNRKALNLQRIDKQNSLQSDCNLLGNSRSFAPHMSGVSLASLSSYPSANGGPLSPMHDHDFQEMTVNPQFRVDPTPGLSQDSVSAYNTCSSCPPISSKTHENVYIVDSYGYEEFEMTDNPYFEYDALSGTHPSKWYGDTESGSNYAEPGEQGQQFEFNENNIYESCTPGSGNKHIYDSNATQSPRFQIVSEKRGDVREKVNLVRPS